MKQNKQKDTNLLQKEDEVVETVRKSKLSASNEFEIKKLERTQEGFLDCVIEEEKESLTIRYDIHNRLSWHKIRKEKRDLMISALIDAGRLEKTAERYRFSLEPDNLYYDIQGRVFVKARDVYGTDSEYSQDEFLREYKSLIGCTLVRKYKFEDYNNGGEDLLKEDKLLSEISECENVAQIIDKLHEEYFRYREDYRERFVEISKMKNRRQKAALGLLGILFAASLCLLGYLLVWEKPYQQAVIGANEAFLQSDYNGTVEAMENVEVERMNVYQKYILAYSCVKCESFGDESMKNILNTISLNGDEKVMEYWIYINRLDTDAAADIAMLESSDQLLYYAYIKEKAVVESDSSLTGQEKNERLSEIEDKLQPLEEEFSELTED